MTDFRIALQELLRKRGVEDLDFLRQSVQVLAQALMEVEVSQQIGANRSERSVARTTYRNGYRERSWDARVGTIDLQIPRLRQGSYFPSLLEPFSAQFGFKGTVRYCPAAARAPARSCHTPSARSLPVHSVGGKKETRGGHPMAI